MVRKLELVFGTMAGLLPWLLALGMALIIVIVFAQRFGIFGQKIELPGSSVLVPTGAEGRSVDAFTFTPRDGIRSIDSPSFLTAQEAEERGEMTPTESVIGVSLNGESKAYPVNILSRHEIANDTLGGVDIAVTF
ncbi:MAG: DUF3179 domain-containing (seleno)protein [Dehalococcoidia bacterium]